MTRKNYVQCVESGLFIDDDGMGYPMKNGQADKSFIVSPSELDKLPADCTHVIWFNK